MAFIFLSLSRQIEWLTCSEGWRPTRWPQSKHANPLHFFPRDSRWSWFRINCFRSCQQLVCSVLYEPCVITSNLAMQRDVVSEVIKVDVRPGQVSLAPPAVCPAALHPGSKASPSRPPESAWRWFAATAWFMVSLTLGLTQIYRSPISSGSCDSQQTAGKALTN